nr:60s ribosomal protein l39-3 [Quercus suber]
MDVLRWQEIVVFVNNNGGAKELKRVLGDTWGKRFVSYGDVSAVAETAYHQIRKPSHKTFMIKKKLAKKMRQNRPIPHWIRMRTDNTISAGTGAVPSLDSEVAGLVFGLAGSVFGWPEMVVWCLGGCGLVFRGLAVGFVSYGDVSAVAETAYHQIHTVGLGNCGS